MKISKALQNNIDFLLNAPLGINAYNDENHDIKVKYHVAAKAVCNFIVKELNLKKAKVVSNKAGIAVCGEVYIKSDDLFLQFSNDFDNDVLYRGTQRFSGNNYLSMQSLADYEGFISTLKRFVENVG